MTQDHGEIKADRNNSVMNDLTNSVGMVHHHRETDWNQPTL